MGSPSLGSKRTCSSCGARFFDLCKDPAVCPKCEAVQGPELFRLKRTPTKPDAMRKAPAYVHVEKTDSPEADEAGKDGDDGEEAAREEDEDDDDDTGDLKPPRMEE